MYFNFFLLLLWSLTLTTQQTGTNPINCIIPTSAPPYFFWKSKIPYFYDKDFTECPLEIDEQITEEINAISFGDSYDWGMCGARKRETANWFVKSLPGHIVLCTEPSFSLSIYATRLYGIEGDKMFSNFSTTEHILNTRRVLHDLNITISAVIYGGFIWDLKHEHEKFCYQSSSTSSLHSVLRIACSKIHSRLYPSSNILNSSLFTILPLELIETWNNFALPWCTPEIFERWKKGNLSN